jgi:hypothetical protein
VGYEFFTSFVFYLFCAAKYLTPLFLRKRLPDFSAKKKMIWSFERQTKINICPGYSLQSFARSSQKDFRFYPAAGHL